MVRPTTQIRPGLSLSAGPLRTRFDGGELRYFTLEDREVLRGIYPAVRGPAWRTVPPRLSALRIEQQADRFLVTYEARHEDGPLRFAWKARIEGRADGTIVFLLDGRAETSFLKNRIGLCVLHPLGCAGGAVEIEHGDGRVERGGFPDLVSPHQPFVDIRAIRHPLPDGRALEVRFEGEWFEMEDQRNWSDASFKTYSTPLSQPFPARMEAGDTVRHEVTVGLRPAPAGLLAVPRAPSSRRWPDGPFGGAGLLVGLDLAALPAAPADPQVERLRVLRPDHLRIGLGPDADWGEALARAAELARACGTRLEVAALVTDEGDLGRLADKAAGLPVAAFLLFRRDTRRSDPALLGRARETLGRAVPEARVGGGAAAWFADLNRHREAAEGADVVAFELCPQVHARDDATVFDTLESLKDMARTAATFAGGAPLRLSPVHFGPREEPVDARLAGETGGDWVRGLLASAEEAGFSALTLAAAFGPGGILSGETPAYRALLERPRGVTPPRHP